MPGPTRKESELPKHAESFRKDVSKDMKAAETLTKSLLALEAGDDDGE